MKSGRIVWCVLFPFRFIVTLPFAVVLAACMAFDREGWSIISDFYKRGLKIGN